MLIRPVGTRDTLSQSLVGAFQTVGMPTESIAGEHSFTGEVLPPPSTAACNRRKLQRAIKALRGTLPAVFGVETSGVLASEKWGPVKEAMEEATRTVLPIDQVRIFKGPATIALDEMTRLLKGRCTACRFISHPQAFGVVYSDGDRDSRTDFWHNSVRPWSLSPRSCGDEKFGHRDFSFQLTA